MFQIGILEQNSTVLSAKFKNTRHQRVDSVALNEFANGGRSDKSDVIYTAADNGFTRIRETSNELHKFRVVAVDSQAFLDD